MAINKSLAEERGISQEDQDKIEELHTLVQNLIDAALEEGYPDKEEIVELIHQAEFALQRLWSFPENDTFHRRVVDFRFKSAWVGRRFKCTNTGEEFTIPTDVYYRACYPCGDGFVDVGTEHYHRASGVKEIVE